MKVKHSKREESNPSRGGSDSPGRLDEHQAKYDSEPSKDCSKRARSSTNNEARTLKNKGFSEAENMVNNTIEGKDLSNDKEGPFSALEVVWAKFSGSPPWPALVLPAEPAAKEGKRSKVHVQACNSIDILGMSPNHAWSFETCLNFLFTGAQFL